MIRHEHIYINGRWVRPTTTNMIDVVDPATGEPIAVVPSCGQPEVDEAVAAARAAFDAWAGRPVEERCALLEVLTAAVRLDADQLAGLIELELGAPAALARSEHVDVPVAMLEALIAQSGKPADEWIGNSLVTREPVGVVAAITPWNYPLYQLVAKVGPALLTGCTVVLKPAEATPLSAYRFVQLVHDSGFPPGVLNLVPGRGVVVGEALSAAPDVDMVSFTGSTNAGRRVAVVAAQTMKRVALELGGKSASLVVSGADLEVAVRATVENCMSNTGQSCSAWTRLLVPRAEQDAAVEIAAQVADELSADMGPLVSQAQYDVVQDYIRLGIAEGARLVAGGLGRPAERSRGFYTRATVFADVHAGMRVSQEEIFGPVLVVQVYDDLDDAVQQANDSAYGLHGAVWAADDDQALAVARRLRTGQVDLNGGAFNVAAPFGGYKQSGTGRELGRFGLEEFLEVKAIQFLEERVI